MGCDLVYETYLVCGSHFARVFEWDGLIFNGGFAFVGGCVKYHSGLFTFDVDNERRNWVKLRLKRMRRKEKIVV
jgi:hypothetical protein